MKRILILIIPVLFSVYTNAQQALTNNGNLQVHTGAAISSFGNFTNTSSGAFINNGTLYIKGNITNAQASMANSIGSLYLDGSSAQSVNGTQTFRTNNLNTNNSSGFTLNNNLSIAGIHTFSSGIIFSPALAYLGYEAGSSYTGSADSRHVNGWVRKTGSTNFSFPVGNGSYQRPIAITALSASSVFNTKYMGATTNTGNIASPLVTVDPYEYWTVNQESGGTAQIAMNWDNSKIEFPMYALASIRVANYTGGLWTSVGGSATGNYSTTGNITSSSTGTFGSFTFGSINSVLPLHFLSITAKRNSGTTLVTWKTADEFNVDHFEVERSNNNSISFSKIGTVKANNYFAGSQYTYNDYLPLEGTAFYRVKSIDIDDKAGYTSIVSVSEYAEAKYTIVNPVVNQINLSAFNIYKAIYRYELLTVSGQLVQAGSVNLESGNASIRLISSVNSGSYIIKLNNRAMSITEHIIIK